MSNAASFIARFYQPSLVSPGSVRRVVCAQSAIKTVTLMKKHDKTDFILIYSKRFAHFNTSRLSSGRKCSYFLCFWGAAFLWEHTSQVMRKHS